MAKEKFCIEYGDKETDFVIPKKTKSGYTPESVFKDTFGGGQDYTLPSGEIIKVYDVLNPDGTVRIGEVGEEFYLTMDSAEGEQLYVINGKYITEKWVTLSEYKDIPTGTIEFKE